MVTPCFDKIGTNIKFDLTEIVPSGYDPEAGSAGDIFLDILTPGGTTEVQYQWLDIPGDFEPGWYNDEPAMIEKGEREIEAGEGIWLTALDGYTFTSAGQVVEKGRGVSLRDGAIGIGNFLARTIDLTELKPTGYDPEAGSAGDIFLDILTPGGTTEVQYQWLDIPGDFEPGWYNDEPVLIEEGTQTFDPGAGMWVTALDGYVMEFPDL